MIHFFDYKLLTLNNAERKWHQRTTGLPALERMPGCPLYCQISHTDQTQAHAVNIGTLCQYCEHLQYHW
jgi:hypothetical protein